MELFDKSKIKTKSLVDRESKSDIEQISIKPKLNEIEIRKDIKEINRIAEVIVFAKNNKKPIIISFGAHLVKNGLGLLIRKMIEERYITHLATNGASAIHDWEFAYQGKSEEDVEKYVNKGQFGIWEETGKYENLALIIGAHKNKGYGESIGELIHKDKLIIPNDLKNEKLTLYSIKPGEIIVNHPFKDYSIFECAFKNNIPITVHPGFGYDIIYTHPLNDGASIGKTAEIDFLRFVKSVSKLEGGIYISIGSSIMSPMIFEKAISISRNVSLQENKEIKDFMIVINDITNNNWDFSIKKEPNKDSPEYYHRLSKSFKRMGSREMCYIQNDNREFLLNLYKAIKEKDK